MDKLLLLPESLFMSGANELSSNWATSLGVEKAYFPANREANVAMEEWVEQSFSWNLVVSLKS